MSTRDALRSKILQTRAPKRVEVIFFGEKIELRQPTLGDILRAQQSEDREQAIIDILVKYATVPGTDESIFEPADADGLKSQPFGKDFLSISKAFEELTEVNFLSKKVTSGETELNT